MKSKLLIKALVFCLAFLSFIINQANAQVTEVKGPSDSTSNPPASASDVSQVLASGSAISLKMGNTTSSTDVNYQWYKLDNSGTKRLVQEGSSSTLTETSTSAGYYTYQLVMSNSNQCSSEISDPFKVYVLPTLNPTIAASSSTICSNNSSSSTLTANTDNSKFAYTYQWAKNGTDISGATSATYTTPTGTSGNATYSVKVAYVLVSSISGTASKAINAIAVPTKPTISIGR